LDGTSSALVRTPSACGRGPLLLAFAKGSLDLVLQDGDETTMALKTMPIAKLQDLKTQIEAAITAKVSERRRELETELAKLAQFGGRGGKAIRPGRGGARGGVAPKYPNPENPAETWAGRGLKPRWFSAAIKGGKKIEDFAIAGAVTASKGNGRKKARKTRK
jgi:DNA-binding protein H-NS